MKRNKIILESVLFNNQEHHEKETDFVICFHNEYFKQKWEIIKSKDQILKLSNDIFSDESCPFNFQIDKFQTDYNPSEYLKEVEDYFSNILNNFSENFWKCLPLVDFLDTTKAESKSAITKISFALMNERISNMETASVQHDLELKALRFQCNELLNIVQTSIASNHSESVFFTGTSTPPYNGVSASTPTHSSSNTPQPYNKEERIFKQSLFSEGLPDRMPPPPRLHDVVGSTKSATSLISNETNCFDISDDSIFANIAPQIDDEYKSSDDEDDSDNSVTNRDVKKVHNDSFRTLSNISILPQINNIVGNLSDNEFDSSPTGIREEAGTNGDDIYVTTPTPIVSHMNLTKDMIPFSGEKAAMFAFAIDEIIKLIQPYEPQLNYRVSAVSLLKRQIRVALSSTTFEVGLHELRCFLPDDPIKLSVIVSKSHLATWNSSLSDHFSLLHERATLSGGNYSSIYPDDDNINIGMGGAFEEYKPICNHVLSNVGSSNANNTSKITCLIDSLEVDVTANSRNDLCMLAFLEELSVLIGKENLFKRSILLIRAWWNYEAASYVGSPIKHYISDLSLCVMISSIFNLHHNIIHQPFHALCLFLIQFAGYDGSTHAISLQGVVTFKHQSMSHINYNMPQVEHLVSHQMINKYWQVFNTSLSINDAPFLSMKSSSSSEDYPYAEAINLSGSPQSMNANSKSITNKFERMGFNVVHPFTNSNMITEKLSQRRVGKIIKAFQIGASNLVTILSTSNDQMSMPEIHSSLRKYFSFANTRYCEYYRPDVVGNSIKLSSLPRYGILNDSMMNLISKIWQSILYCNLIIESIVTESALITLSIEILSDKGPLPVGEIGKILAELTSIPNLSVKLKEKFGGLKKFLERFPEKIFISNDHPFNPNVVLRNTLSNEHLELIDRGLFPMQLIIKSKKILATSKKQAKTPNSRENENILNSINNDNSLNMSPASNSNKLTSSVSFHNGSLKQNNAIDHNNMIQSSQMSSSPIRFNNSVQFTSPNKESNYNSGPSHHRSLSSNIAPPSGNYNINNSNNNSNNNNNSHQNLLGRSSPIIGRPNPLSPSLNYNDSYNNTTKEFKMDNNVYIGTNNNNNNSMLSHLRDGSTEVLTNDYNFHNSSFNNHFNNEKSLKDSNFTSNHKYSNSFGNGDYLVSHPSSFSDIIEPEQQYNNNKSHQFSPQHIYPHPMKSNNQNVHHNRSHSQNNFLGNQSLSLVSNNNNTLDNSPLPKQSSSLIFSPSHNLKNNADLNINNSHGAEFDYNSYNQKRYGQL